MTLKGFKLLTSAWHLEYFKIPLSKKKYLCNQKCRELKITQTDTKKNQSYKKKKKPTPNTHTTHTYFFGEHFPCS